MKEYSGYASLSMITLLGFGLLLAGALGPWLEFPLTSTLYARDFTAPWAIMGFASFKSLLICFSLLAALGYFLSSRLLTLVAGVATMAILSYFFYAWLMEEQWLQRYITESEQRIALQEFLAQYYWPNLNPEPTTTLAGEFEYLHEQVRVFWYATGWGWGLCMAAGILLLIDSLFSTTAASFLSLAIVILTCIVLAMLLYPVFYAEHNHRQGDFMLGSGQPREAISAYETALVQNPALQHSRGFLTKASRAFYQLEGKNSILAGLYLTNSHTETMTGRPLSQAAQERLEKAGLILTGVMYADYQGSILQMAILRYSGRAFINGVVAQGLDAYVAGSSSISLGLLQQAFNSDRKQLHLGFFLSHLQRELGLVDDSIASLEEMLDMVDHKSVRADLLCSIGDTFSNGYKPLQAREAYTNCLINDSLYNYRAVLNLGGT